MGPRAGQVALDRVEVRLAGDATQSPAVAHGDDADPVALYAHAYTQVFQHKAPDLLDVTSADGVRAAARELGVTVEVYIYAVMLGHKTSSPERRFTARSVLAPAAAKRVVFFRAQAARDYGTVDVDAVTRVNGDASTLREELMNSEILFGGWIVGERVTRGGNGVAALYRARLLGLSPYWLATEPSFAKWATQADPGTTDAMRRHIRLASLVDAAALGELRRLRGLGLRLSMLRVLQRRGVPPRSLRMSSPITNAFRAWLDLGTAVLQLQLLRRTNGEVLDARTADISAE